MSVLVSISQHISVLVSMGISTNNHWHIPGPKNIEPIYWIINQHWYTTMSLPLGIGISISQHQHQCLSASAYPNLQQHLTNSLNHIVWYSVYPMIYPILFTSLPNLGHPYDIDNSSLFYLLNHIVWHTVTALPARAFWQKTVHLLEESKGKTWSNISHTLHSELNHVWFSALYLLDKRRRWLKNPSHRSTFKICTTFSLGNWKVHSYNDFGLLVLKLRWAYLWNIWQGPHVFHIYTLHWN